MSWFISHYIIVSSYPWLCPHCPPCFDLSWAKTMKFDGGVFCLSFYLILMWFPLRIFWLNRPRVQAGAQADCAAHAIAGSGWKKTAIVVTGAIPAWWPSSAVGLVPVLLASRFDWVIVLHISIFPYFLTVQSVRGAAYLGAANFCFGLATATATIFLR